MNKKFKFICTSKIALMLVFVNIMSVSAITNDDTTKVKDVINQYFTNELKTISTQAPIDSRDIISNESLKEVNILKASLLAEWYKEIDQPLKDYKLYLEYNTINFNGNGCIIDVVKGSDLIFEKSPDVTQMSRGENHIITLKHENNEWTITKDIYAEDEQSESLNSLKKISDKNYKNALVKKSELLKEKMSNIKDAASKLNETRQKYVSQNSLIAPLTYSGYSGQAAMNYAYIYFKNYNPAYHDWSATGEGGDCTNFISQCLKQGGLPTDTTWFKDSNAWIRVIELRNWLVNKGYATEYDWQSNCKIGDVIQLFNKDKNVWSHSMLISYIDPYGQAFIASHDSDQYNYALYNYYPTDTWSNIRYLKITT